jgi:hypothetical protein
MKAILKFNLPEEQPEFDLAVNGNKWSFVAWKIDQELRSKIKYSESITEEQRDIYQEVRNLINEYMIEQGLDWE